MRFGESKGAFDLTKGIEEAGENASAKHFGPTLGSRILRRQQTGATRFCSEYLASGRR